MPGVDAQQPPRGSPAADRGWRQQIDQIVPHARPPAESEPNAAEEEAQGLWTPDWDDEDSKEDFLSKLRQELGADKMKE